MNMKLAALIMAACALAACTNNNTAPSISNTPNSSISPTNTTPNSISHTLTRTFLCENGISIRTTTPSNTLGLSVEYGSPQPANVVLNREGNGYRGTGLFGNSASWLENGNVATFSYVHQHSGQTITTRCSR